MYIHGSFLNQRNEAVTVHIVTGGDRSKTIEIGGNDDLVSFTDDPVEITSEVNDTFDHLLKTQASIKLYTRIFLGELFCASSYDAVVNIYRGDECIFAGFVEPQTYSQGFNESLDEIEINCIDVLTALEDSRYRNVGAASVSYESVKASAAIKPFDQLLTGIIGDACSGIDLNGESTARIFYDCSKSMSNIAFPETIFARLGVSEQLFFGDDEDNVWTQSEVIEEMLRYLDLHIIQQGFDFYIFSWSSLCAGEPITWHSLSGTETKTEAPATIDITVDKVIGTDTQMSIGQVYNQMLLTCEVENVESIVESPLDSDSLASPYTNRQKYLTEISSDGEGIRAMNAFALMVWGQNEYVDYENAVVTDWYIQVRSNPQWSFPDSTTGADLIETYCTDNSNQQRLPNALAQKPGAAIISIGSVVDKVADRSDNSPVSKIDMSDYLVVSVNGNGKDKLAETYPKEADIKAAIPSAVYRGGITGGAFSPADYETTNYIVLSGSIILNPRMEVSADFTDLVSSKTALEMQTHIKQLVPSRDNADGRFYTHKYWKAETPMSVPQFDSNTQSGLVPFTGTGPEEYEFKYSAIGDGDDHVSKVAALACMLVIGDKCVVETGTQGRISDFTWKPYKRREDCASDDEYYQQSFTIGFDPKIGDKLIGTEFNMQNNIDFSLGIDAEGIAIPIRKNDKVSGQVSFMILGPVNTVWGDVSRRHPTFFRHTKWSETSVPLLAHVSSIFVKDFDINIYSDNGLINNFDDSDLVYMSDTDESFINRKDDITFKIHSALTADERRRLGVSDSVCLSTPVDTVTGGAVTSIYSVAKETQAKPEQLYVDSYYNEYHQPRVVLTQCFEDRADVVGLFNRYRHPAMPDKIFFVQSLERNLIEGSATLTLKEIWN